MDTQTLHIPAGSPTPEGSAHSQRRLTLRKADKLRHKILVDSLFAEGQSLFDYPLRVKYRWMAAGEVAGSFRTGLPAHMGPVQMLATVPKRKRRHAVDRVAVRRRIREAYRLERPALMAAVTARPELRLQMAFVYVGDKNEDYAVIARKMHRLLGKIEAAVPDSCHGGAEQ